MPRLLLVNPNTTAATTTMMAAIAEEALLGSAQLHTLTVPFGAALIIDEPSLATAACAVQEAVLAHPLEGIDGVIVAAFGDPGLDALRARLPAPVTGIAEAAMACAAAGQARRRFAVVTTTPLLVGSIEARARHYGHADVFTGVRLTPGDPVHLMADAPALLEALRQACHAAIDHDGAQAIVIGGGPLAVAARALSGSLSVPLIEPVPEAARLALRRALQASGPAA